MNSPSLILDIGEILDLLQPQFDEYVQSTSTSEPLHNDLLASCWVAQALAQSDVHVEYERPSMSWKTYYGILNIKHDYAVRVLEETVTTPIRELVPSGSSLIAKMQVVGRDLHLHF